MPFVTEVTNARSRDDHEIKANKPADFADRCSLTQSVSAQKYSISNPTLFTGGLWSAHEDSIRGHF